MKKVVVFGAGLVVRAHVRYLLDNGFAVTVASRTVSKAEDIVDGHPNGTPMAYDITVEPEKLASIIAEHDVRAEWPRAVLTAAELDAEGIAAKLVARHPHVFGDVEVKGTDELVVSWEARKVEEKGRGSVLDGVPTALPALSRYARS